MPTGSTGDAIRRVTLCAPETSWRSTPYSGGILLAQTRIQTRECIRSEEAQDSIMVKLDIENAFNCLDRIHMLTVINEELPEIAVYCHLAYAEPSDLKFGTSLLNHKWVLNRATHWDRCYSACLCRKSCENL